MATTIEELEAQVNGLRAQVEQLEQRDPVQVLRRLLAEYEREGPKSASAAESGRTPDLDAARARAQEDLRQMRLKRRRG